MKWNENMKKFILSMLFMLSMISMVVGCGGSEQGNRAVFSAENCHNFKAFPEKAININHEGSCWYTYEFQGHKFLYYANGNASMLSDMGRVESEK
jgi:hypothetical protein